MHFSVFRIQRVAPEKHRSMNVPLTSYSLHYITSQVFLSVARDFLCTI
uniref:Uncharacterized protein n=1 Tax=Anguilla anguilla TaxID=7936 RepID=A0A0E9WLG7_ANGAN